MITFFSLYFFEYFCNMKSSKAYILTILMIMLAVVTTSAADFPYRSYIPIITSPSEDVTCMYFDSEGMLWVGTNAGLKSYDGYTFRTYRSDAFTPGILPNNTIRSITEDHEGNLWLGTRNGLVRMNRRAGTFQTFYLPAENQRIIYTLYTSKDGTVWIGTDGGLSYYDAKNNKFYTYNSANSWIVNTDGNKSRTGNFSPKAILEDRNGEMLIGTWNSGLMRLYRKTNTFVRYPLINSKNSVYSLFFDSHHRLWAGSWGNGIVRIDNPDNLRQPKIHQYPYSTGYFDTFYKIVENRRTHTLWACTREGICSLSTDNPDSEWKQYNQLNGTMLNFCNGMEQDRSGNLWICTQNSGIIQTTDKPSPFHQYNLSNMPEGMSFNYVWSLLTTNGNQFWLGLNPYGIALYDKRTGLTRYNRSIPGFQSIPAISFTTSVSDIVKRNNGEIWFATNSYGIIVYKNGRAKLLDRSNTPVLRDNYVNSLYASPNGDVWIGTRSGLNVVRTDNRWERITMRNGREDLSNSDIRHIMQARDGSLWVSTDNRGIIHITGKTTQNMHFYFYNPEHGNFAVDDATACLADKHGRLWAISNSGGLFLYNAGKDAFEPKNRDYHIPGSRVIAINEDASGNLWMTTDRSLVQLLLTNGGEYTSIRGFTGDDGLQDVVFSTNSTTRYGHELFFGNSSGFFSFTPSAQGKAQTKSPYSLVVTDILIDDTPIANIDSSQRVHITEYTPAFAHKLKIPAGIKKFAVDFALLTYGNAGKNRYAYMLDGYDEDWQFTGNRHIASFQNLPDGSYKLKIKAMDGDGNWTELPYSIKIRVLPPWYATWWAYIIYMLLAAGAVFAAIRWYRERLRTQNRLRVGQLMTNITHELMTPLTVVVATVQRLHELSPQYDDEYHVIDNNLRRATRLLRQILEVRKSQAGQLRLKVNRHDIAAFVQKEAAAIRPMAESKQIELKVNVPEKETMAWFDTDKLDKILYNLISNAIKYNKVEGHVIVSLSAEKDFAVIKVADNGIGMSKQQLHHLYTRFFDGDYRRQNEGGTGLGLALAHELVKLHHGHIDCESHENAGTTFTVTLPTRKSAYAEDEIDKSTTSSAVDRDTMKGLATTDDEAKIKPRSVFVRTNAPAVLVVEDNDDLRELMRQTLSKHYRIFTARNGKQAWNIIQKQKLDLVITDVMMPVMDGIELLEAIKNDKGYWQLPVMLLTAKNQEADKKDGYAAGADAYIVKPFDFDELIVRADALIDNRRKTMQHDKDNASSKDNATNPEPYTSNPDQVFVYRAKACVMKHIDDPDFDRESFAKEMLISSSTLYNKLRALTGKNIVEFINDIRLEEAHAIKEQEPGITISELSARVGFNTPKYFSKLYRKKFEL